VVVIAGRVLSIDGRGGGGIIVFTTGRGFVASITAGGLFGRAGLSSPVN
jgi:hypothetical protein